MRLLMAAEVASSLQVSVARVYELGRSGLLRPVRLGRQVRWDEGAILDFVQTGGRGCAGAGDDDGRGCTGRHRP